MNLTFSPQAWEDYTFWQATDPKTVQRIHHLLKEITRNPHSGIGKPEPLKHALPMDSLYTRAQRAMAELKGAVFELLAASPDGLTNAEIGRRLGIYRGHVGHEGHISRTILAMLEAEEVALQNKDTKRWTARNQNPDGQALE